MGEGDDGSGGSEGGEDVYRGRAEPVLVSLSDLYSEDDSISVRDSRPSSSPAYIATDYFLSKSLTVDFIFPFSFLFYFTSLFFFLLIFYF